MFSTYESWWSIKGSLVSRIIYQLNRLIINYNHAPKNPVALLTCVVSVLLVELNDMHLSW